MMHARTFKEAEREAIAEAEYAALKKSGNHPITDMLENIKDISKKEEALDNLSTDQLYDLMVERIDQDARNAIKAEWRDEAGQ